MAFRFESGERVADAVVRTSNEQLLSAESELRTGAQDNPVEAVHSARKSLKKERALLRLSKTAIGGARRREANTALRDAARALSQSRDAEVLVETLDELAERFAGQLPEATFSAFRDRLDEERQAARGQLSDPTLPSAAADEVQSVRRRIGDWDLRAGGWSALAGGLDRTYRRGRRAFRQARLEPEAERLHEWRKRSKDLWYELRLLAPVGGHTVRGHAKEAHALADLLGDEHDLAVLRNVLQRQVSDVAADLDAVVGLIDHRRAQLQGEAMFVGERVYAESPNAFAKRMRRSWKAGRGRARAARALDDPADLPHVTRAARA